MKGGNSSNESSGHKKYKEGGETTKPLPTKGFLAVGLDLIRGKNGNSGQRRVFFRRARENLVKQMGGGLRGNFRATKGGSDNEGLGINSRGNQKCNFGMSSAASDFGGDREDQGNRMAGGSLGKRIREELQRMR